MNQLLAQGLRYLPIRSIEQPTYPPSRLVCRTDLHCESSSRPFPCTSSPLRWRTACTVSQRLLRLHVEGQFLRVEGYARCQYRYQRDDRDLYPCESSRSEITGFEARRYSDSMNCGVEEKGGLADAR